MTEQETKELEKLADAYLAEPKGFFWWAPLWDESPRPAQHHAWPAMGVEEAKETICGLKRDRPATYTSTSLTKTCETCKAIVDRAPLMRLLVRVRDHVLAAERERVARRIKAVLEQK